MGTKERSATQLFRQAHQGQLLEHVALIQELEEKVHKLQTEVNSLRSVGGTDELQQLPIEALRTLLTLFDAVPIPDLAGWERRQSVTRLSTVLEGLQSEGKLPAGTWSGEGDEPELHVAEGDGAAAARVTRAIVKVLGEAGSKYLAQMVEFQGSTPDHVSRARAASLMDISSLVDAKAQFGLLPEDGQRDVFEQHVDELIHAKDQLATVTGWMNEGRTLARELLSRLGLPADRNASLLGLLRTLAEADEAHNAADLRKTLHTLVNRYAALLPSPEHLETLSLKDSTFQRTYVGAVGEDAQVSFLAAGLVEVLADHEQVSEGLRDSTITARERGALRKLNRTESTSPERARRALLRVFTHLNAVEEVQSSLEAAQKDVVKRFLHPLESAVRDRIMASPNPEAHSTAYERLSKVEKNAYLAGVWSKLAARLKTLIEDPTEGIDAIERAATLKLIDAVGSRDVEKLDPRRRALSVLAEALRNPPGDDDDLTLSTAIDVEQGLIDRQSADLDQRVSEFLARYSNSKRAGMQTIADAAAKLAEINALKRGKRDAIDQVAMKSHRGKLQPKKEAELAAALAIETREVGESRATLLQRKRAAYRAVEDQLDRYGLSNCSSYDALITEIARQEEVCGEAALAREALAEREEDIVKRAKLLSNNAANTILEARSFAHTLTSDESHLRELARAVQTARKAYLEEANRVLRKKAPDFGAARVILTEVGAELDVADALRSAAATYVTRFGAFKDDLKRLTKVRSFVKAEAKKAAALKEEIEETTAAVAKTAKKLARPQGR